MSISFVRLIIVLFIGGLSVACTKSGGTTTAVEGASSGGSTSSGGVVNRDYSPMFINIADNIIIPNYKNFAEKSSVYSDDSGVLESFCSAIGTESEDSSKSLAQSKWFELMAVWQVAELHQVGPVTESSGVLRNRIHSYGDKSADSCAIDKNVIRATEGGFDITLWGYASRGLGAIEYLLFNEDLTFSCASEETEFVASWDVLSVQEKRSARCHYAMLASNDVADAALAIEQGWAIEGGDYRSKFVDKDRAAVVLQELSDAVFFLETVTKDIKLGITTGLKASGTGVNFCDAVACPERVESPYSQSSLVNIKNNLESFWQIYTGAEGEGFDDIISSLELSSVNSGFELDVQAAITLLDQLIANNDSVILEAEAILVSGSQTNCINSQANPDAAPLVGVCSLHGLIKRISDRLRTDFVVAVNVSLPASAQSDAD